MPDAAALVCARPDLCSHWEQAPGLLSNDAAQQEVQRHWSQLVDLQFTDGLTFRKHIQHFIPLTWDL